MADKRTILTLEIIEEPTAFGAPILQFRMGYDDADAGSVRAALFDLLATGFGGARGYVTRVREDVRDVVGRPFD